MLQINRLFFRSVESRKGSNFMIWVSMGLGVGTSIVVFVGVAWIRIVVVGSDCCCGTWGRNLGFGFGWGSLGSDCCCETWGRN